MNHFKNVNRYFPALFSVLSDLRTGFHSFSLTANVRYLTLCLAVCTQGGHEMNTAVCGERQLCVESPIQWLSCGSAQKRVKAKSIRSFSTRCTGAAAWHSGKLRVTAQIPDQNPLKGAK